MKNLWFTGVIVILASLMTIVAGCSDSDQSKTAHNEKENAPGVVVQPVVSKAVTASVEFVGQTEQYQKVDLRARVNGTLLNRAFVEGAKVEVSALMYEIDPAEFIAARDAAAAKVARAEATLVEAERSRERYETLVARETASVARFDEAKAKEGQSKADLAAAKADLERANLDLGYTKIASPISGKVGRSSVDAGNLIGPDSGILATVLTLDPIYVIFSVTEREFLNYQARVRDGKAEEFTPKIRLANNLIYPPEGKLNFMDNRVDPTTGTIKARLTFPNPDGIVLPGQFVNVILMSAEPQEQLIVPQAAVQENQAGAFVLVVDGESRVQTRPITTGQTSGTDVVVTDGLTEGETIIVDGIQKVRPGGLVNPVAREPKTEQG